MLPIFDIAQSRAFDAYLIENIGLPSLVLMENAARGCVDHIRDWLQEQNVARVLILAGTGNNGGDGLAIGRLLEAENIVVQIQLVGDRAKLSPDAKVQLGAFAKLSQNKVLEFEQDAAFSFQPTIVIDALLGTGSSGAPREPIHSAISLINELRNRSSKCKVLSIDIPTGLNADRGLQQPDHTSIVKADRTVSMAAAKLGFYQGQSKTVTGSVRVATLGAAASFQNIKGDKTFLVETSDVRDCLPSLDDTANKFTRGRVLALCGSRGMTGAAIMAATSALRSGCGLVNVAVPKSERSLVAQAMPELLTVGCTEQEDGAPDISAWSELEEHLDRADTILIGSGLRPWKGTAELLRKIIAEVDKPMVIDAGALGALVGHLDLLKSRKSATILTPHGGEIARLVERPWQEVEKVRLNVARKFATEYGVVVAMKGAPTYTIDPDGTAYINSTGNAGLATAGSGDVLAGIMAGMLVQRKAEPRVAAMLAVYLHGLAGDIAAEQKTRVGMTATDVTHMLPLAFKQLGVH